MASESVEFEIQQVDGQKTEEPAWSVTNSRLVINLYRDNPVLYDKNRKDLMEIKPERRKCSTNTG